MHIDTFLISLYIFSHIGNFDHFVIKLRSNYYIGPILWIEFLYYGYGDINHRCPQPQNYDPKQELTSLTSYKSMQTFISFGVCQKKDWKCLLVGGFTLIYHFSNCILTQKQIQLFFYWNWNLAMKLYTFESFNTQMN